MILRAALVAAFASLLVLPPMGQRVIATGDEARFVVLAQDSRSGRGVGPRVEREAGGGPVGIAGGRFFSIDFYLGRSLVPLRTVTAFRQWLARPEGPVSVVTGRSWSHMQGQLGSDVEVIDTMRVRKHLMFMVRRPSAGPSR